MPTWCNELMEGCRPSTIPIMSAGNSAMRFWRTFRSATPSFYHIYLSVLRIIAIFAHDRLLLVGINYDCETKTHSCRIE